MEMYGNVINRFEEGQVKTEDNLIHVGDDITMYLWSDRNCYYVTEVIDQKHIKVKRYDVKAAKTASGMGHQDWEYTKNDSYPEEEWCFRYNKWKEKYIGYDDKIHYSDLSGKVSFGVRDYYYDWEF